jgi:hypothetical protein
MENGAFLSPICELKVSEKFESTMRKSRADDGTAKEL